MDSKTGDECNTRNEKFAFGERQRKQCNQAQFGSTITIDIKEMVCELDSTGAGHCKIVGCF